jgi:hypothetical protein
MSAAHPTTTADNDHVRVTTWTFGAEGDATGPHRHEFDYIVVPVTGGTFLVTNSDTSTRGLVQVAGSSYLGVAGTAHDVVSTADHLSAFVEVELKR